MMKISIREIKGQRRVYQGTKLIGYVVKSCCGTDFRHWKYPGVLFSILKENGGNNSITLKESIAALLSIKIPKKSLHYNFSHETAINKERLKAYEQRLNKWTSIQSPQKDNSLKLVSLK